MVQNPLLVNSLENEKGFLSIIIPNKVLEAVLCPNFAKKNVFLGEFWLTVSDRDTETTQILYHSQTNTFAVISRIFLGIMDSSLFLEWCTNQSGFPKKS